MRHRFLACIFLLATALPAVAADTTKQAAGMANSAKNAYEAGDHERAMDLFLQAWKIDHTQPIYIYSAGRAAHVAKKLEMAERDYNEFLAQPNIDERVAEKARDYLREIGRERLDRKVAEGEEAERAKLYELAIRIYDDVLASDPTRQSMSLLRGRALLRAGRLDDAEATLRGYKQHAPGDSPGLKDADAYLAQIEESRRRQFNPATGLPDGAGVVAGPPPKPLPVNNIVGWSLVGAGGVVAVVGLVQIIRAVKEKGDLDDLVNQRNTDGRIYSISFADAVQRSSDVAALKTQAAILGGAGLAAAAFGGWWLWARGEKADEKAPTAAIHPLPGGGSLAVSWRF